MTTSQANIWKIVFALSIMTVIFYGCSESPENGHDLATLEFHLELDKDVYLDTIYGQPPQIAIWIENPENGEIINVWVSYRTGKNKWIGKSYCDVGLPYWQEINGRTKENRPYHVIDDEEIHAYTMATPSDDIIEASTHVPKNSEWNYYIEVNVSGDFNEAFPSRHPDGYPDLKGNGQPSIIYKGSIVATTGQEDNPAIIGRTKQWEATDTIIKDTSGITTAAQLLKQIKVTCKPVS